MRDELKRFVERVAGNGLTPQQRQRVRHFGMMRAMANRKKTVFNPESAPDEVWGDVGAFAPDPHRDANHDFLRVVIGIVAVSLIVTCILLVLALAALARDNGEFAGSPLKPWFDKLASPKGLCCSFADGRIVEPDDWGTREGQYWVVIGGVRYAVPPDAVVTEPNRFHRAVVWPYAGPDGSVLIRCFIPGAQS